MRVRVKKILVMFLLVGVTSCASFRPKYGVEENVILTEKSISRLNQFFELKPSKNLAKLDTDNPRTIKNYGLFNLFGIFKNLDSETINNINTSSEKYLVNFKVEKKSIKSYLLKDNAIIDSSEVRYNLKKNGFLYLKRNSLSINLVPFIYGGWDINRSRIGLTNEGDLIYESSHYSYAAILLLFGDTDKQH
ncbi:MAG: hypothetical protein ACI81G_001790, partial [Gammaproteobacteria bacterium]